MLCVGSLAVASGRLQQAQSLHHGCDPAVALLPPCQMNHVCTSCFPVSLHTNESRAPKPEPSAISISTNAACLCSCLWALLPGSGRAHKGTSEKDYSCAHFYRCGNRMHMPQGHTETSEEQLGMHPTPSWHPQLSQKQNFIWCTDAFSAFWRAPCKHSDPFPNSASVLHPLHCDTHHFERLMVLVLHFPKDLNVITCG